jgi:hypothetical protein
VPFYLKDVTVDADGFITDFTVAFLPDDVDPDEIKHVVHDALNLDEPHRCHLYDNEDRYLAGHPGTPHTGCATAGLRFLYRRLRRTPGTVRPLSSGDQSTSRAPATADKTREEILHALTCRIRYSTAALSSITALRYVALARSEHSGQLHIVGGAATFPDVLATFTRADDFCPEAVVDVAAGCEARCVLCLTGNGSGTPGEEPYSLGITDLRP